MGRERREQGDADQINEPSVAKKIGERLVSSADAPESLPFQENLGWPVADDHYVRFCCHPSDPNLSKVEATAVALIKPWRWRRAASHGTGKPEGQWYAGREFQVSLVGDTSLGGPMERVFLCNDCEKIFFQLISIVNFGDPDEQQIALSLYSLLARDEADKAYCPFPDGDVIDDNLNRGGGPSTLFLEAEAYSTQRAPVAPPEGTAQRLVLNPHRELVIAGYDWLAEALRTQEVDPLWERDDTSDDISDNPESNPAATPNVIYVDLFGLEHHSLQVQTIFNGIGTPDLVKVAASMTNKQGIAPATFSPADWTPVNTELFGTAGEAPIDNSLGDVNRMFFLGAHISAVWLRIEAWNAVSPAPANNVAVYVRRKSWW